MGDIFISYLQEDSSLALEIAQGLEQLGYKTWVYERDSYPGPSYLTQIKDAIEKCQAIIIIITPRSIRSIQMTTEVFQAYHQGKPRIPILHEITYEQFEQRQPEWYTAMGSATCISIPSEGVAPILDRIARGLGMLGINRIKPDGFPSVASYASAGIRNIPTPARQFAATCFKIVSYRFAKGRGNILSTEGSYKVGGKFNAPGAFGALYLSCDPHTCIEESVNFINASGFDPANIKPRVLYGIKVNLSRVFDLTNTAVQQDVGISKSDLSDTSRMQLFGRAIKQAGFEAIIAPSTIWKGSNICIFPDNLLPDSTISMID